VRGSLLSHLILCRLLVSRHCFPLYQDLVCTWRNLHRSTQTGIPGTLADDTKPVKMVSWRNGVACKYRKPFGNEERFVAAVLAESFGQVLASRGRSSAEGGD